MSDKSRRTRRAPRTYSRVPFLPCLIASIHTFQQDKGVAGVGGEGGWTELPCGKKRDGSGAWKGIGPARKEKWERARTVECHSLGSQMFANKSSSFSTGENQQTVPSSAPNPPLSSASSADPMKIVPRKLYTLPSDDFGFSGPWILSGYTFKDTTYVHPPLRIVAGGRGAEGSSWGEYRRSFLRSPCSMMASFFHVWWFWVWGFLSRFCDFWNSCCWSIVEPWSTGSQFLIPKSWFLLSKAVFLNWWIRTSKGLWSNFWGLQQLRLVVDL